MTFNAEALSQFYAELCHPDGMEIDAFQQKLTSHFSDTRSETDIEDYRVGKFPWKKLRDEVGPVADFLEWRKIGQGRVRFPLDNDPPDCWLTLDDGSLVGIEVTLERGRERYLLAKELNDKKFGRGFIGVQDDASTEEFDNRLSKPRVMFSPGQALTATEKGILRCISRKNDMKYDKTFYLVIQANLISLPRERWDFIKPALVEAAKGVPFQEVHVIGDSHEKPWGFQIK